MRFNPIRFGNAYPTQRTTNPAVKFGFEEVELRRDLTGRLSSGQAGNMTIEKDQKVGVLTRESPKDGFREAIVQVPGSDGVTIRVTNKELEAAING